MGERPQAVAVAHDALAWLAEGARGCATPRSTATSRQGNVRGGAATATRQVAEGAARDAPQSGETYDELLATGIRYASKEDHRRAAKALREAIALSPDEPRAYACLGITLSHSGHYAEAAQRLLEATERYPVDSEDWAMATAAVFDMLRLEQCDEVAKPEWWNDEGLKALSARVVRAAPGELEANRMRALVLRGRPSLWEVGTRSAAELREAAAHFERAAALCPAPAAKAVIANLADRCRRRAEAM